MKNKLCLFGLGILLFVFAFMFSFILFWSFLNIFVNFKMLSAEVCLGVSAGCSGVIAILLLVYSIIYRKSRRSTKFGKFLSQNCSNLILFYCILCIICVSIKPEIILSFDDIKELVSLEWTIFGIAVTIFLVWNAIILNYLKEKKPQKSRERNAIQQMSYIEEKGEFYFTASMTFLSVTFLIINSFLLIPSTVWVYTGEQSISLVKQNVVTVSLYFCTNTLISLLLDIVRVIFQDKRSMLKETKVSNEEVAIKNDIEERLTKTFNALQEIATCESIDEEEREKIKVELINKALNVNSSSREQSKIPDGKGGED